MSKRYITQEQYKAILAKVEAAKITDDITYAFPGVLGIEYPQEPLKAKYYIIFYEPDKKIWGLF